MDTSMMCSHVRTSQGEILLVAELTVLARYNDKVVVFYYGHDDQIHAADPEALFLNNIGAEVDQRLIDWTHDFLLGYSSEPVYDIIDAEINSGNSLDIDD
jgi:hypothetical protein